MSHREDGFTLIEIVVSLAIFLVIVVGAFGVLSASNVGALGAFPTAFGTGRDAMDITTASVYLQALQEYAASQGSAAMGAPLSYTCTPGGGSWSCTPALPAGLTSAPQPTSQPFELAWTQLVIDVSRWNWDSGTSKYISGGSSTTDNLIRVRSTLSWKMGTVGRALTVERFIP